MKKKSVGLLGLGVLIGMLIAPKKGSEFRKELMVHIDNVYLSAKELNIDSVKDKIEDIKIEISKLDAETSKEFISSRIEIIKNKLISLIEDLQNNESIKPTVENALQSTKKAINDTIDYIDEKKIVDKAKEGASVVYDKSVEVANVVIEKSSDLVEKASNEAKDIVDKASEVKKNIEDKIKKS